MSCLTAECSRPWHLKLMVMAEKTRNAVVATDSHGCIEWVNEAFSKRTGFTQDDALGKLLSDLLSAPGADPATRTEMRERIEQATGSGIDIRTYTKAGRAYWQSLEVHPVLDADANLLGYVSVGVDISDRVQNQDRVEEALRSKDEFVANMSHEIRTPMNGVIGMIDVALTTALTADQRRYLDLAKSSAMSLMHLINDILDMSKIDARKMPLEPEVFDLHEFLAHVLRNFTTTARAKHLCLRLSADAGLPRAIVADKNRLSQVLTNLLGNALKFTEYGEVEVAASVEMTGRDKGQLKLEVRDTGVGIAPSLVDRVFEPFVQVDASASRRQLGTGLGLTIACKLVELMGGHIDVTSSVGQGSRFTVVVPVGVRRTRAVAGVTGLRVLLVEADDGLATMYRQWLHRFGSICPVWQGSVGATAALIPSSDGLRGFDAALISLAAVAARPQLLDEALRWMDSNGRLILLIDVDERAPQAHDRARRELVKPFMPGQLLDMLVSGEGHSAPGALDASAPPPSAGPRVLLVEDDPVSQMVAEAYLQHAGYAVDLASDGIEAVGMYAALHYEIVITDLHLPGMSGIDLTRKIRLLESTEPRRTAVLGLSASAMKEDRQGCMEAGMDDFLAKPVTCQQLCEALARHLKQSQPESQLADNSEEPSDR